MTYTVKQLAGLAGVSVRTLHYYDHIGLLKPTSYGENGYRRYDDGAAMMLQQVLFFRELGFALEEIRSIVTRPDFDVRAALESHRAMLLKRRERVTELIATVERTIAGLEGETAMEIREYYRGFSDAEIEEYRSEVRERWGERALRDSESRVLKMGQDGFAAHQAKGDVIFRSMVELMPAGVDCAGVQELVERWREWLEGFAEYSDVAALGVARMYSEDARFSRFFARYHPDLPAFFTRAVERYCGGKSGSGQPE